MSAEENKAIVRRIDEEMWNKGNLDFADEVFTSDFVQHVPASPEEIRGPEGYKQNVATTAQPYPIYTSRSWIRWQRETGWQHAT
jgi:predicted SnoaL-like aldol condensation-catalyzing enzyme